MRRARLRGINRAMSLLGTNGDEAAPELSLLNLVDLMLVFAVGLLLAIVSYYGLHEVILSKNATMIVSQPGSDDMEIVRKTAGKIERMRLTRESLAGQGVRIGIAYRLDSGEVVYVPEGAQAGSTTGSSNTPQSSSP